MKLICLKLAPTTGIAFGDSTDAIGSASLVMTRDVDISAAKLHVRIEEVFEALRPHHIIVDGMPHAKKGTYRGKLGERLRRTVDAFVAERRIEVIPIARANVKRAWTGRAYASREDIRLAAILRKFGGSEMSVEQAEALAMFHFATARIADARITALTAMGVLPPDPKSNERWRVKMAMHTAFRDEGKPKPKPLWMMRSKPR